MSTSLSKGSFSCVLGFLVFLAAYSVFAQAPGNDQLRAESNPRKRAELALNLASDALDDAGNFYKEDKVHQGDAKLENMTGDLKECLSSLRTAHKGNSYQKAELKVAHLQRRLHDLIGNLNLADRGWAEQTERTVDEIHDEILSGAMKK